MFVRYAPLPPIWPGGEREKSPKRSAFATSWAKTQHQLDTELWKLGMTGDLVIETGYPRLGPCHGCGAEILKNSPNQKCPACRRKK